MARGNETANTGAKTASQNSNTLFGNSEALYSVLAPTLESQMANPAGMGPTTLAKANTAAQQSAGGSVAGAVGQGGLLAARTRNKGAPAAAVGQGITSASEALSKRALDTQLEDAALKEKQRSQAESGLQSLTGTEGAQSIGQGGNIAPDINADVNAENASWNWAKDIFAPLVSGASQSAGGYLAGKCWIAEAIYGVDDPRTHIVRAWLNGPFSEHWYGRSVMSVYGVVGRWVARKVARHEWLKDALKPLFDLALSRACNAWEVA